MAWLTEPRPGAPRTITDDQIERVIVKTADEILAKLAGYCTAVTDTAAAANQ